MPEIVEIRSLPWPLSGNQRLAWHSPARKAFVIGNHADKSLVPADAAGGITPLVTRADAYAVKTTAYDDQLPPAEFEALRTQGLDGFQFLTRAQYDAAFAGQTFGSTCPVDQALTSGLTCQMPVLHPASNAICSIADKKITLQSLDGAKLTATADLKLRGPLTAVFASPVEAAIYYGTNAGDVFRVPISPNTFGPQKKLAAFGRVVSGIRLSPDGRHLIAGGMGFLATLVLTGKAAEPVAKLDLSCRSIHELSDRWLLLNHGMHGLSLCECIGGLLRQESKQTLPAPADRVICSADGSRALVLFQPPAGLGIYELRL